MVCRNCGTENPVGSVFCKSCGARIDGRKVCPTCRYLNLETNAFCNHCGTRIDGKRVCKNCGGVVIGSFCSKCGTRYGESKIYTNNSNGANGNGLTYASKVLDIVSNSVLLLGAVLSLIFIFFVELIAVENIEGNSIFQFIGNTYENLKEMILNSEVYYSAFLVGTSTTSVMVSVVIIICIICCLIFTTLAVVKFIRKLCFGGEKSPALVSLLSVIFYFICATSFKNILYVEIMGYDESIIDFTHSIFKFNDTTKTGSLLTVLCVLAYLILAIIKRLLTIKKDELVNFVFAILNAVILIVVVSLVNNSLVKVSAVSESGEDRIEIISSFSLLSSALASLSTKVDMLDAVVLSGVIQAICVLVIFLALLGLAKAISEEKNKLSYSICIFTFLLIAMILNFVVISSYYEYLIEMEVIADKKELSIKCTKIIASFISSFILLIVNVIYSAIKAKLKSDAELESLGVVV